MMRPTCSQHVRPLLCNRCLNVKKKKKKTFIVPTSVIGFSCTHFLLCECKKVDSPLMKLVVTFKI